jgi:hypothetical protein
MSAHRTAATIATLLVLTIATPMTAANAATPATSVVQTVSAGNALEHAQAVSRYKTFLNKYYGYHIALVQEKNTSYRTVIAFNAKGKVVARINAGSLTSKEIKSLAEKKRADEKPNPTSLALGILSTGLTAVGMVLFFVL